MDDCIFCKIVAGELPSHKLYEDERVLAFLDINPVNPGHALIIPKEHAENYLADDLGDLQALIAAAQRIAPGILRAVGASAHNLTSNCGKEAGQVVFHTHFHLIPRFSQDGHEMWKKMEGDLDLPGVAEKIRSELEATH